jgi:ComF family protein
MQVARLAQIALDLVFPPSDTARVVRSCSPTTFCTLTRPRVLASSVTALLPYWHPWVRAAIIEAKFHHNTEAIMLLHTVLAEYLEAYREDIAELGDGPLVIVPIPLGSRRRKERGYNQTEEIAHDIEGVTPHLLVRTRDTHAQTTLSRTERRSNMRDAFDVIAPIDSTATYMVVDDVVTTGATLAAAGAALTHAGACEVQLLALAH